MTVLNRMSPRSQGVDARGISAFIDALDAAGIELHSLMVVRHGTVVAEGWWRPYDRSTPHLLYSLSKSFTSVAAGIAEDEGLLRMSDRLADMLPEAESYGEATIADALRMSVGHLLDPVLDPSESDLDPDPAVLRRALRDYAPERAPGEVFTYDQLATFAVAEIVQRAAGCSLLDYLRPRLFEPLGAREARWVGDDTNIGFTGLYLTTESLAAFGQLLLQGGVWEGRRLIPAAWLHLATTTRMQNDAAHRFPPDQSVEPDSTRGYGYQFWIASHGYLAGGAYSQNTIVLPELDAVIAMTASTQAGQAVLDAVWEHIVPALDAGTGDEAADDELQTRLEGLSLRPPASGISDVAAAQARATLGMLASAVTILHGDRTAPAWRQAAAEAADWTAETRARAAAALAAPTALAAPSTTDVSGIRFTRAAEAGGLPPLRFGGLGGIDLPEITAVRLVEDELHIIVDGTDAALPVANDRWLRGEMPGAKPVPFTTWGGWTPDGLFEAELRMIETPHVAYLRLDPVRAEFTITWREPTIAGRGLEGYRV